MTADEERLNKVFNQAVYLQLLAAFVPRMDFNQISEYTASLKEFLETRPRDEVNERLPFIAQSLKHLVDHSKKMFPLKKDIDLIAAEWNSLFKKSKYTPYHSGISYQWLNERIDISKLQIYDDYIPFNFKIGLGPHKGHFGIEEHFILQDSFAILVKAQDYFEILQKYGERAKTELTAEGKNSLDKDRYQKVSDIKFEVCAHSRLTTVSFFSFVEAFVNSIGLTHLHHNEPTSSEAEKDTLRGLRKGSYLSLRSKIEKFQGLIRPDKSVKVITSDINQVKDPFKSFFNYYEELRNASVHYSYGKEHIWMAPQDWIKKAEDFSKLAISTALEFWRACYPNSDGPKYLGKLEYDRHLKIAKERLFNLKAVESELGKS